MKSLIDELRLLVCLWCFEFAIWVVPKDHPEGKLIIVGMVETGRVILEMKGREMAHRSILHINKLEAFKSFLDAENIAYRPGKGGYQVLQVLTADHGWQCIFSRHDMPEHYSINDKLYPLVRRFLKSK